MHSKACDICLFSTNDAPLYGEFESKSNITVHYLCLLSSQIPQRAKALSAGIKGFLVSDIRSKLPGFRRSTCYICGNKSAAVVCSRRNCKRKWHYKCGRENAACITQFTGQFKSFCDQHIPDTNMHKHQEPVFCPICFELIETYHPANSLISQCCLEVHKHVDLPEVALEAMKTKAFVHSECLQRYTYNAGYFAKCTCCCMKAMDIKVYQEQMRLKGIFVPMKDSEWEKDEYFKKMTKNKCEHSGCPTPSSSRHVWTCVVCGCHPRHLSCAKVKSVEEYYCMNCIDQSFVERVPFTARYKVATA